MTGDRLRAFGLDLSEYVLDHLRQHLEALPARPASAPWMHPTDWNRLDMPAWVGRVVAGLPRPAADLVWAGVGGGEPVRAMTDDEMSLVGFAVDDPPMGLDKHCVWRPAPHVHRRAVGCVPEIRAALTTQTAEEWAVDAGRFASQLGEAGLPLARGIAIVGEWLRCVRRLLDVLADDPRAAPAAPPPPARPWATAKARQPGGQGPLSAEHVAADATSPDVCDWHEAMAVTGLKKSKLYASFARGVLTGYRDGGMIRFYRAGLIAYMRDRENAAAPPLSPRPARAPRRGRTPAADAVRFKFL